MFSVLCLKMVFSDLKIKGWEPPSCAGRSFSGERGENCGGYYANNNSAIAPLTGLNLQIVPPSCSNMEKGAVLRATALCCPPPRPEEQRERERDGPSSVSSEGRPFSLHDLDTAGITVLARYVRV